MDKIIDLKSQAKKLLKNPATLKTDSSLLRDMISISNSKIFDIDLYADILTDMVESSSGKKGGRFYDNTFIEEFLNGQYRSITEKEYSDILEELDLTDNELYKDLSIEEMRILIDSFKNDAPAKGVTQEKQDKFRGGLETIISFTRLDIKALLDDKSIAKTQKEQDTLNGLLNINLETLSNSELLQMHNVITNLMVNGEYIGGEIFAAKYNANKRHTN
jgi:hypothetical protein